MDSLANKQIVVIGLGASGEAACKLLRRCGARVTAVDSADSAGLRERVEPLRKLGVDLRLGADAAPSGRFELAVLSPGVPVESGLVQDVLKRGIPLIGELELGYRQSRCLNISITGTNGKTTTTELVERLLVHGHRKTIAAGNIGLPVSAVVERTRELDFLVLEVSSYQLETIQFFRPAIGVLLNITPDHLDRYESFEAYARAKARLFVNQQPFDWAVVQSEALARLRALNARIPGKIITFSANDPSADIYLDRGLLISRLPQWAGPLLDTAKCRLRGPHNAENMMAALAVGRILRIPLEEMTAALMSYAPAAHRCEFLEEVGGVQFVNDSKATNLDAVAKAVQAMPAAGRDRRNVILIAGGKDKGLDYHDLGPLLVQRVKQAVLIGETREKLRAAWSLFTPCTFADSLPEAVKQAAAAARPGEVVLLSPGCSSFDMFENYQHRGEVFRAAVQDWAVASGKQPGTATGPLSSGETRRVRSVPASRAGGSVKETKFATGLLRESFVAKPLKTPSN